MSARDLYAAHVASHADPLPWEALTPREQAGWICAAEERAKVQAEALQAEAMYFETEAARAWGGAAGWMTTGDRVGELVASMLRERATELLNDGPSS